MQFEAKIHVMLKRDVADVQGMAIQQSLKRHGDAVDSVKAGKYFELHLEAASESEAKQVAEKLARETFSNPVIEHFWIDVQSAPQNA